MTWADVALMLIITGVIYAGYRVVLLHDRVRHLQTLLDIYEQRLDVMDKRIDVAKR